MEKSTDSPPTASTPSSSTASSAASVLGSGNSTTTESNSVAATTKTTATVFSDANQRLKQQEQQKHRQRNTIATTSTPTKNPVNNSLGCGLSTTLTTKATTPLASSLLDRGIYVIGNNLKSNNNMMSINNTSSTLGHKFTSKSTTINNNNGISTGATILSNSSSGSVFSSTSGSILSSACSSLSSSSSLQQMAPINLNISTTTGGNFSVSVDPQITVENLKKIIAKKLKVSKDRICLLHREKELQDGLLKENNLTDGSKIILIPNVETGLLAQRPENTVMQALESLNDSQVNDFLSGKTPLNLSMRLGDHMMLIQLQLSTVNPVNGVVHNGGNCGSSSSRQRSSHHHHHHHRSSRISSVATQTSAGGVSSSATTGHNHHHHHHHHHHHGTTIASAGPATASFMPKTCVAAGQQNIAVRKLELDTSSQTTRDNSNVSNLLPQSSSRTAATTNGTVSSSLMSTTTRKNSDLSSFLSKRDYESLQNIVKSIAMAQPSRLQHKTNSSARLLSTSNSAATTNIPNGAIASVPVVSPTFHSPSEAVLLEQSPIKSLSNLVSSPIKTTSIKNIPNISNNSSGNTSSLTNLVAIEPHTAPSSAISASNSNVSAVAASAMCQDPIAAKLTSCLCTRLNGGLNTINNIPHVSAKQCIETVCISQQQQTSQHHHQQQQLQIQPNVTCTSTSTIMHSTSNHKTTFTPGSIITPINGLIASSTSTSKSSSSLHKTAHNPISRKHRHHHHHHHHHHHYHHPTAIQQLSNTANQKMIANTSAPIKVLVNDSSLNSGNDLPLNVSSTKTSSPTNKNMGQSRANTITTPVVVETTTTSLTSTSSSSPIPVGSSPSPTSTASPTTITPFDLDDPGIASDSRTLAEASRSLTQTLRKLSKEVFTNKIDFSASAEASRKSGSGAVIESMKNHGKGIYSGTFSGTLNPALQDRYGRPKRDISTVIHILNDLLSATPQYHRGARISFETPSTSTVGAASVAAASGSSGTIYHSSRTKHLSSKHHQSSHPCVKCIKTHNSSSATVNLQSSIPSNAADTNQCHPSSSSSTPICTYSECNGQYVSNKSQLSKIYSCCQQGSSTTVAPLSHQQHGDSSSTTTAGAITNGHHFHHHSSSHHHHHHHHNQMVDERKVCQCRYRVHSETGERERDYTCQKCATELDNIKTKSKLDQLRLVMQQRKQKREARKLKGAPYGARVVGTTTTAAASNVIDNTTSTLTATNSTITTPISVATSAATSSEVSPNHLVEEVDTAA